MLSQRWRDGNVDFNGFWYDNNMALSHEDYGSAAHWRHADARLEHGRLSVRQRHRPVRPLGFVAARATAC